MPTDKPRTIFARDLERRQDLEKLAKELRREASDLDKERRQLDAEILDYVRENSGPEKTMTRSGFALSITLKRKSVPWKQRFLEAMGRKAVDTAEAEAEETECLVIERIAKKKKK